MVLHNLAVEDNVAMFSELSFAARWQERDRENCQLYGVAWCPLFRGYLSIEVNGIPVGTFRIVRYIMGVCYSGVSVKRGSTVP